MAVDGSIYQHARAVQNRTVSNGDRLRRRPQTISTGLPVIKPQQRKLQQIRRSGYAVASRNKLGAADRKKQLGAKAHDAKPSPVAIPGSGSLPLRRIRLTRNTKSAPPGGFRSLLQNSRSEAAARGELPMIARHSPREAGCGKLIWSSRAGCRMS